MAEENKDAHSGKKGGAGVWIVAILVVAVIAGAVYLRRDKSEQGEIISPASEQTVMSEQPARPQASMEKAPSRAATVNEEMPEQAGEQQPEMPATATAPGQTAGGTEASESQVPQQGPATLELADLAGSLELTVEGVDSSTGRLPLTYSCYRDNVTPPLAWSAAPEGTQSFALFMEQRKPDKKPYVNWVLFNIPADKTSLQAGLPRQTELTDGTRFGRNDNGVADYAGPCDPKGKVDYAIRLFALDTVLDKDAEVNKDELIRAMNGHIIDEAEVTFYHILRP